MSLENNSTIVISEKLRSLRFLFPSYKEKKIFLSKSDIS